MQVGDTGLTANTLLDRETWGLDDAGNWLSHMRSAGNLMETRTVNSLNQLTQIGGAGSTVIEGQVSEFANVTVAANGGAAQAATLRKDPVEAGKYRFERTVPVNAGSNTVTIAATDLASPGQAAPLTTTKSWQFNVPALSRSFSYDASGNTLSDGVRTMTWDAKNRLRTVTKDGTTWKWDYDFLDRRVREYENNVATKLFIWSGTELVQERTAANAITRTHYTGGFSDGATPTTGTKYQTLTDHLGNIREVLTTSGTIAARYDYTPYQGPVKIGTSTVNPTFLTIGAYYHHEGSGLELALYRAYDPVLGRWLSRDPIEEEGGINMYGYIRNRPSGGRDALGLEEGILGFLAEKVGGPLTIGPINAWNVRSKLSPEARAFSERASARVLQAGLTCIVGEHQNAARHAYLLGALTQDYGSWAANELGNLHEVGSTDRTDTLVDKYNNGRAIGLGMVTKTRSELESIIYKAP